MDELVRPGSDLEELVKAINPEDFPNELLDIPVHGVFGFTPTKESQDEINRMRSQEGRYGDRKMKVGNSEGNKVVKEKKKLKKKRGRGAGN